MAQHNNPENDCTEVEQTQEHSETTELQNVGENLDMVGGRVLDIPDFVDLALQGFSEGELKSFLKLRRRYNETEENEVTPEFKRLRFARFLYDSGKIQG
ncbi:MAG TPA: hypothetical protein VH186_37205 [Chloroflexia bacterium]|nr:hypothetical protein [Chloroflexia bacterium]